MLRQADAWAWLFGVSILFMSSAGGKEARGGRRDGRCSAVHRCLPLMPPIACKSRRMRCTCLPASPLILYSHMELRPNLIEKGRESPLVLSIGNLTGLCRLLKIISFVKVCFSIIANYSSTVLESPKMLLCKQSCFTIKKHLPSWRCHGVTATVTFQSLSRNYYLADSQQCLVKQTRKNETKRKLCFTGLVSCFRVLAEQDTSTAERSEARLNLSIRFYLLLEKLLSFD